MRQTGFFHHIGTFLLFSATVLLIITDISAPVVNSISMLKINLDDRSTSLDRHPTITFGTFGYCVRDTTSSGQDLCTRSHVGYDPAAIVEENVRDVSFSDYASDTSKGLTRVMILHPIATGLAFIAFLLALGAGVVGSLLASLVSLLTFIVTLVVLITDFVSFSIIRSEVNQNSNSSGSNAEWGAASWTVLVSAICSFLATFVVFFTCCSARLHRRREGRRVKDVPDGYGTPARRRRWW
ncbi:pali-domain-containing protein [Hypoxylon trugodes]|uniref:pali-domain-containing protein n=1 Tax=Hypoxylon trugodes TaxID=326681 RepID=UPI002193BAEE|nr:pali-domain-containing protein [Hypoxylon trugodes]KAI1394265.1 pali-domain-containing protein [Hypoxylon trugodes]